MSQINNAWNALLAKWLARKDILRLETTVADSPYAAVSVLTNKLGQVAYVSNEPETEGDVVFGNLPLPADALPVFTVQVLTYGVAESGSKLIHVTRSFEKRQDYYVVGDIGANARMVDGVMVDGDEMFAAIATFERQRAADASPEYDGYEYVLSKTPYDGISDAAKNAVNGVIDKVVTRINAGKPSVDTRTETWGQSKVPTAYGKFRAQQKAESAQRKAEKDAAKAKAS